MKKFKKMVILGLAGLTLVGMSTSVFADTKVIESQQSVNIEIDKEEKEEPILLGEFVEYKKLNGEIVLEEISANTYSLSDFTRDVSYPVTRYTVYDEGIVEKWATLSRPYFIRSIATGQTYEKSQEITKTISATFSGDIPSEQAVKKAFSLSASGTKKVTEKVTFSGPAAPYTSRDFYYKEGTHKHKVKTEKRVTDNLDWNNTGGKVTYHIGYVGEPALKYYSEDTK